MTQYRGEISITSKTCLKYTAEDTRKFEEAEKTDKRVSAVLTIYADKYYPDGTRIVIASSPVVKTIDVTEYLHFDSLSPASLWETEELRAKAAGTEVVHAHTYDFYAFVTESDMRKVCKKNGFTMPEEKAFGSLNKKLLAYIGLRGDADLDDKITADDAQIALNAYTAFMAEKDYAFTPDRNFGGKDGLLCYLASMGDGKEELTPADPQSILLYYVYRLAGWNILWDEIAAPSKT